MKNFRYNRNLYPKAENITFFDVETVLERCKYEDCKKKFTIKKAEWVWRESKYESYWRANRFHECHECGQKYQTKADHQKNIYGEGGGTGEKPLPIEY